VKRLRVLHLDSGATWRGGQRQALLLALGLRERGHEPFLIGSAASPLVQRARAEGLAVSSVRMRADWDLAAARKIRSYMRTWRPDIVHAHDARSHALSMLALMGRRRIPLVVTRRVAFTPRSVRLKYGDRVARFIAISNAVRDAMVAGGIDAARIEVVRSGVPVRTRSVEPRDWRGELGWPEGSVLCGVVGAMSAEKGIGSLEAIAKAMAPAVRGKTRLLLIGGKVAGDSTIGGVIAHSAGFVNDIDPAVAGLDMLWHPSRAEGLGTAIIDAMSLGVVPVAFATGGVPEVIRSDENGILVPAGDSLGFADAASRLIGDPELRHRLAQSARRSAASFSAEAMTKGTEAVYYAVLSG